MFAEVKRNLPVSGDDYDDMIIDKIRAAALDLSRTADIILPGTISISKDPVTGTVNDTSTLKDSLIIDAITLYCQMRIGNPPNYDKLLAAYDTMKGNLRISSEYTDFDSAGGGY